MPLDGAALLQSSMRRCRCRPQVAWLIGSVCTLTFKLSNTHTHTLSYSCYVFMFAFAPLFFFPSLQLSLFHSCSFCGRSALSLVTGRWPRLRLRLRLTNECASRRRRRRDVRGPCHWRHSQHGANKVRNESQWATTRESLVKLILRWHYLSINHMLSIIVIPIAASIALSRKRFLSHHLIHSHSHSQGLNSSLNSS